ncbi:MAG: baseplate J/gp47 family protein [Dehalococcoidia bacterium]|nr:baseplate J/gp47 family protein [Dehalococcoidia bacterium]
MNELLQRLRDLLSDLLSRLRREPADPENAAAEDQAAPDESRRFSLDAVVVTASRYDDVPAVIGRIEVAASNEVVLIVPRDVRALRRASAWPHLAAYARQSGVTLGVIADRRDVRSHARAHGLPAASSLQGLRRARVRGSVRDGGVGTPGGRMRLQIVIVAVAVLAAVLIACYRVPTATVVIVPPSRPYSTSVEAQVNAVIAQSDAARGIISVSTIRRDVTTVVSTATTGTAEVGDTRATLELRFSNQGTAEVRIPGGARIATPDRDVFVTDEDVVVPPGEQAIVTATADRPGTHGNVDIGEVSEPETPLPSEIFVVNRTRGVGGTDRTVPAVSAADIDRVRQIATGVLDRVALVTLDSAVTGGRLLRSTVSAAIFSAVPLQQLNEPADAFLMEYVIVAAALWIPDGDAAAYGAEVIRSQLAEGLVLLPGTVTAIITEPLEPGDVIKVDASGLITDIARVDDLPDLIAGKSPEEAAQFISERLDLEVPPVITIQPSLIPWRWLPRRAEAIVIRLEGPPDTGGS